ncbi:site-2 protease family protein [Adhaeribacter radiodurans]|uniref:M50 family metallopeptidase n=1 Tax=Adhaeribacter radiodurans TaxID=2745197 RepID=A0A7L7L4Y4_9BACT|nr:site-2 protease family protein [Adhaeribacter radiodurans]QMU27862.1 M50 family metallopeptidase [Adhaeribacter radiodurans]
MFGWQDIPKFVLAFFLVLPVISFLHEVGHVFFAWLMGGKNIKLTVGSGDVLFRLGLLEVRKYYFWYGHCSFDSLIRNQRLANIFIFSGGVLFNALTAVLVMYLVQAGTVEAGMLTYQFTYFSMYYIFFAVLPMPYPDGSYSDGKVILDLIRNKPHLADTVYRITWSEDKRQWQVLDANKIVMETLKEESTAIERAQQIAKSNRPSRVIQSKEGQEMEIGNYPKVPL